MFQNFSRATPILYSPLFHRSVPTSFVRYIFPGGFFKEESRTLPSKQGKKVEEVKLKEIPKHIDGHMLGDSETFVQSGTHEIQAIREKYSHLDFDELRHVLDEADSEFFQYGQPAHPIPTHHRIFDSRSTKSDTYTAEMEKMDYLLPYKWEVGMWRSSRLFKGSFKVRFRSIMIGGNGKGLISFGFGAADQPGQCWEKALEDLRKNLLDVSLIEGRTIHDDLVGKFNRTKVLLFNRQRGFSVRAGKLVRTICLAAGILDITGKVVGRRNPFTVVRATFNALEQAMTWRQIALDTGLNYYELSRGERCIRKDRAPTQEEMKKRTQEIHALIAKAGVHFKQVRTIRDEWCDLTRPQEEYYDEDVEDDGHKEDWKDLEQGPHVEWKYDQMLRQNDMVESDYWDDEIDEEDEVTEEGEEVMFENSLDWPKFMSRDITPNENIVEEEMIEKELSKIKESEDDVEKAEDLLAKRKKEKWWAERKKSKIDEKREQLESMRNIIQEIDTHVGIPNHPMFDTYKIPKAIYEPLTEEEKSITDREWTDMRMEEELVKIPNHSDIDQEAFFRKMGYGYGFSDRPSPKHLYDKFQVEKEQDEIQRTENEKKLEQAKYMEAQRQKAIREIEGHAVHETENHSMEDVQRTKERLGLTKHDEKEDSTNWYDYQNEEDMGNSTQKKFSSTPP